MELVSAYEIWGFKNENPIFLVISQDLFTKQAQNKPSILLCDHSPLPLIIKCAYFAYCYKQMNFIYQLHIDTRKCRIGKYQIALFHFNSIQN